MSEPDRKKANAYVTPDVVRQTLMDMIDIRSPTGSEAAMAGYIVDRLRRKQAALCVDDIDPEIGRPHHDSALTQIVGHGRRLRVD